MYNRELLQEIREFEARNQHRRFFPDHPNANPHVFHVLPNADGFALMAELRELIKNSPHRDYHGAYGTYRAYLKPRNRLGRNNPNREKYRKWGRIETTAIHKADAAYFYLSLESKPI